ncbi:MAG: RluA family pseudouridine synthase [Clostridia bacterium]|nr:RluA family pseudouridine synthase [Clostridia bacterium]
MTDYFKRAYKGKEQSLTKVLQSLFCDLQYNELMKLLRKKDVFVNGKRVSSDILIKDGDSLELYYQPSQISVREIYSDDNILVVFKNKGMISDGDYSFEGLMKYKYGDNCELMHRLDTNTEGLLMFSRNKKAYNELRQAMKDEKIDKYYYAKVNGKVKDKEKILQGYLKKDSAKGMVKVYDKPVEGADYVEAYIKTLSYEGETTQLEVRISGGKTHQIRAQLAHYGHFIIGDGKYGNDEINRRNNTKKQQLTAYKLVFKLDNSSFLSYLNNKNIEI